MQTALYKVISRKRLLWDTLNRKSATPGLIIPHWFSLQCLSGCVSGCVCIHLSRVIYQICLDWCSSNFVQWWGTTKVLCLMWPIYIIFLDLLVTVHRCLESFFSNVVQWQGTTVERSHVWRILLILWFYVWYSDQILGAWSIQSRNWFCANTC